MTKKSASRSTATSKLSGKLSNLNRRTRSSQAIKSSKSKHKVVFAPNDLKLVTVPENISLRHSALAPVNELKIYKGTSKKVFTRNSWGVPIAYITSTPKQMKEAFITQQHLIEELRYTRLLHSKFPFILNAEEITANNEARVAEGTEFNDTPSIFNKIFGKKRIFVYKKEIVDHVDGNTPDILQFMVGTIFAMSNSTSHLHFAYLDMKPANVGIKKGTGEFVILDNGPDLCYVIPKEFIGYFQKASIIVCILELNRPLTDDELVYLRTMGLTRQLIIATFHKRLDKSEESKIIEYALKYYNDHGMSITAEDSEIMLPRKVINHYSRIKEYLDIEARRQRINKIMKFTRLEQL